MDNENRDLTAVHPQMKKVVSLESFVFIGLFIAFFGWIGSQMGIVNMLNTMMNTAFDLLINTCFYIMAIAVLAGAIAALFTEFGVVAIMNKILSPLMKPVYGLPGASVIGVFATYLSDNPAILTLADDHGFRRYFKKYQLPALCNIGTAFGMGLIITTFMMGIPSPSGESFVTAALIGNLGAIIGSVVSVRIMLMFTSKYYGTTEFCDVDHSMTDAQVMTDYRMVRPGSAAGRFMNAMLEGGKSGVDMGMAVIPGVLIICTVVMMLTNGASADGTFTGAAYEGIGFLPMVGEKLGFILEPLFGFTSSKGIAVPVTALGAAGAAIGLIPGMVADGLATGNDIAVFTAMCMCWSGYLSTHVAMMDSLKCPEMTGKAIISHTFGGLVAGFSAHWIYVLLSMLG
ncbi:MAG: hypothetical protein IJP15_08300 [Oscillospiraceae bacterium]|nr:hypothetical protein [Oscillospiraceae bacterium]